MSWFNRHVHDWEETGRVRLAPVDMGAFSSQGEGTLTAAALWIEGKQERTSVHLQCRACGDVESRVLMGWAPPPSPDELAARDRRRDAARQQQERAAPNPLIPGWPE